MPKPVLSDSLFNADNVATAILNQANLSVTNQDFAVSTITSEFTVSTGFNMYSDSIAYSFNGFVFLAMSFAHPGPGITTNETIFTVSNTYKAITDTFLVTSSYEGDTAYTVKAKTDGSFIIESPHDIGGSGNFYMTINGFYRHT